MQVDQLTMGYGAASCQAERPRQQAGGRCRAENAMVWGAEDVTQTEEEIMVPSAMEVAADAEDLNIIRELYGSRARTSINSMLAFDAFLKWYYPYKESIPFMCPVPQREEHTLRCMRAAIDMHEMYERIGIRRHSSFLLHGAVFKCNRDILRIGDPWAASLSALELQNAETKRTANRSGSRNQQVRGAGQMRLAADEDGQRRVIETKGYSTTMSISTLQHMLTQKYLRRGDGIIAVPASRRAERIFGAHGPGRSKVLQLGKLESVDAEYSPRNATYVSRHV